MPAKVRVFIEHLEKTFSPCSQFSPRPSADRDAIRFA
jgi:hypothetical protein